jgi:hypothetical protein
MGGGDGGELAGWPRSHRDCYAGTLSAEERRTRATMCCFSQDIDRVSDTRIFARGVNGRQVIAYSMAYAAQTDLAMVLPLPVPPRSPEDAVRFISLEEYPGLFHRMEAAFPSFRPYSRSLSDAALSATIAVQEVGDFEASFVPALNGFERLDPRFRIPRTVWDELPEYQDYGFAVFKLKASTGHNREVHPMAFEFPRRQPALLYFPTLHVHDGTVQPGADFDHTLYCQPEPGWDHRLHLRDWRRSGFPAGRYLAVSMTQGLVDPAERLFQLRLTGRRQNIDTCVSANSTYPQLVGA